MDTKDSIKKALSLHNEGNLSAAEAIYCEVLSIDNKNTDALNLLGMLHIQKQDFLNAVSYLKKAIELKPCAYFYQNLGLAYFKNQDFLNSINCYNIAIEFDNNSFDAWFNLAMSQKNILAYDEAIESYNTAIKINPDYPDTYFNLANIFERKNDTETALKYYKKAFAKGINYSGINYFLSVSFLKLKDFKHGWIHYEYRPSKEFAIKSQELAYPEIMKRKPLWRGENIEDKTLFVYYDSALGDTIMYARYLPVLKNLCKKLIFKPQNCFIDFFKLNNFGAEIIDNRTRPCDLNFDFHIPIMSIPYILRHNSEEDIPLKEGYLQADKTLSRTFREKYFNNEKLKIGIKWMGNPTYDQERIIPVEMFFKLMEFKNTQFYSLQKGDGIEELQKIPKKYNLIDLSNSFNDFGDTAAAIENLDLVICNDTSVAHLAAAMGKECWILLPFMQNWRWHNDLSYSPWYNNVKLFKQNIPDDWTTAFEDVYELLKAKVI